MLSRALSVWFMTLIYLQSIRQAEISTYLSTDWLYLQKHHLMLGQVLNMTRSLKICSPETLNKGLSGWLVLLQSLFSNQFIVLKNYKILPASWETMLKHLLLSIVLLIVSLCRFVMDLLTCYKLMIMLIQFKWPIVSPSTFSVPLKEFCNTAKTTNCNY